MVVTVNDGIPPDIVKSILLIDLVSSLADNDANLTLIIQRLSELRMWIDLLAIRNNASASLGEDDRVSG
jgi:hypothetical protein